MSEFWTVLTVAVVACAVTVWVAVTDMHRYYERRYMERMNDYYTLGRKHAFTEWLKQRKETE